MKIIFFLFAVTLTSAACTDGTQDSTDRKDGFTPVLKTKEDSLYYDVVQGHDVGMAKMEVLGKYTARAQSLLDSLAALPKQADTAYRAQLLGLQQELQAARQGMNEWMKSFTPDSASGNEALRIRYLESEKAKVTRVRDQILSSLQKADSLFKK